MGEPGLPRDHRLRGQLCGPEPYRLNLKESEIVDVAEAAGAVVVDRRATYLVILAASTRIDPARLDAKLAELERRS